MKKILVNILLAATLLSAAPVQGQHYIGVRGGYGMGYGRFYPSEYMKSVWGLWSGGVAWKYYSHEKYIGGIGAEVEFIQRAFEYNLNHRLESDSTYRRTINTINIPLIWQPHINLNNNRFRLFLNAGVFVAFNLSSVEEKIYRGEGVVYRKPYTMMLVRDNPLNFGLQGGLGFNIMRGKWEFSFEARYYFSYGDILRSRNKYQLNNYLRSPVDNINISLGVFYLIGDKPHAPPPTPAAIKRRAEKEAGKEAKRMEKTMKDGNNQATESR